MPSQGRCVHNAEGLDAMNQLNTIAMGLLLAACGGAHPGESGEQVPDGTGGQWPAATEEPATSPPLGGGPPIPAPQAVEVAEVEVDPGPALEVEDAAVPAADLPAPEPDASVAPTAMPEPEPAPALDNGSFINQPEPDAGPDRGVDVCEATCLEDRSTCFDSASEATEPCLDTCDTTEAGCGEACTETVVTPCIEACIEIANTTTVAFNRDQCIRDCQSDGASCGAVCKIARSECGSTCSGEYVERFGSCSTAWSGCGIGCKVSD